MDVQAYIQSGIIQDYCLGLLCNNEMQEVEQHAAISPEIKTELRACRQALEQYARSLAMPVPPALKNKMLGLVDNLAREKESGQPVIDITGN
jgi:hypothetical protein